MFLILKNQKLYMKHHIIKYFGVDKVGDGFGSEKDGENGQHPHFDHWGDGGRIYTAVLYLNDEYEGGEITFYEDNDESKPIPYKMNSGSLVYFDGYTKHAVENLISGQRASFILHIRHLGED
jgi:predicted 2-oxoglutarate/Fe(II)-dependent dioxygenase YbiX